MAQVRITLDQDLLDTLQAQADQAGITLSALIAEKAQYAPAAANAATQEAFTLDQATDARASVSGVNLDDEAADLLRFQEAYNASAKIIEIASKLFETILALK